MKIIKLVSLSLTALLVCVTLYITSGYSYRPACQNCQGPNSYAVAGQNFCKDAGCNSCNNCGNDAEYEEYVNIPGRDCCVEAERLAQDQISYYYDPLLSEQRAAELERLRACCKRQHPGRKISDNLRPQEELFFVD